jgi:hypothetical protein
VRHGGAAASAIVIHCKKRKAARAALHAGES